MQSNTEIKAYRGNSNLKKEGEVIEFTEEMVHEYLKCARDPVYFCETYVRIIDIDEGLIPFTLRGYQKRLIESFHQNRNTIAVQARQSGKTTTYVGFALHHVLFSEYKSIGLLANKESTARQILSRIKLAFEHLPKWLQQGVVEWNKSSIELENGSQIIAAATSSSAIRGYSLSCLILDECAHIENWDEFYTSVMPTISSGKKSKMIVVSTPKGLNHFYEMVENARQGKNSFKLFEVSWREVPGRDEKWKEDTLAELNYDYQKFAQEHENEFLGSSGTLISGSTLKELQWVTPEEQTYDGIRIYEPEERHRNYVATVDVGRGKGLDYSAIQVIDVTQMPYRQVATFHSNLVTPVDMATYVYMLGKRYNNATVLIEVNDIGGQIGDMLRYDYEYDDMIMTENAGRAGKRVSAGSGKNIDMGIRMTTTVKMVGCSILKMLIESGKLTIVDYNTIHELSVFSAKGNSFEAEQGEHDDLVDPLIIFAWLSDQTYFEDLTEINTLNSLRNEREAEMFEDLLPEMVINDGVDHGVDEDDLTFF